MSANYDGWHNSGGYPITHNALAVYFVAFNIAFLTLGNEINRMLCTAFILYTGFPPKPYFLENPLCDKASSEREFLKFKK